MKRAEVAPLRGFTSALRLNRFVLVLWIARILIAAPAVVLVTIRTGPAVQALPEGDLPAGEISLILGEALAGFRLTIFLLVMMSILLGWLWTIIWHGGIVNWRLWSATDGIRVAQIMGLGLLSFWRYFRLALTTSLVAAIALFVVWAPLGTAIASWIATADEGRVMPAVALGMVISFVLLWMFRAASLRAAWLLGRHDRRSAVMAYFAGLVGVLKRPVASLGSVALYSLLATGLTALPLILGLFVPGLRGSLISDLVALGSGLVASLMWLALFMSFAPVSGLIEDE